MNAVLIDANVLLDLFTDDPEWAPWSEDVLFRYGKTHRLVINAVVYSEVSIGFDRIETLEHALGVAEIEWIDIPREALFLAGEAFLQYRRRHHGTRRSPLPDFYIGAHAAVDRLPLLTRDENRYRTYFPTVSLITPSGGGGA